MVSTQSKNRQSHGLRRGGGGRKYSTEIESINSLNELQFFKHLRFLIGSYSFLKMSLFSLSNAFNFFNHGGPVYTSYYIVLFRDMSLGEPKMRLLPFNLRILSLQKKTDNDKSRYSSNWEEESLKVSLLATIKGTRAW